MALDCELEAVIGARVFDVYGHGVLSRVPEEADADAVALTQSELPGYGLWRHGISTSLTRATVVRSAT
jgi:hypothetical protein